MSRQKASFLCTGRKDPETRPDWMVAQSCINVVNSFHGIFSVTTAGNEEAFTTWLEVLVQLSL
jgi:hypothetical protein